MRQFGITSETRGSSNVSIPAPTKLSTPNPQFTTGYSFPVARLVAVKFNPAKPIKRNGVETTIHALEFLLKDEKDRQFTHIEFPIDPAGKNPERDAQWQDQRIKHIWEETIGADRLPKEGLGTSAKTESEYFKLVAEGFNAVRVEVTNPKYGQPVEEGKDPHPEKVSRVLYGQTPIYVKLTYNKTNLQLPLFPNFFQRAMNQGKLVVVDRLLIDLKYDQTEPSISASNTPSAAAGLAGGLDNTFGTDAINDDLPDFLQ